MPTDSVREHFISTITAVLDETFEQVQGIFLDKGTALFETLGTITAAQASRPVGGRCASIAAQIDHVRYYLEVLQGYINGQPPTNVDWQASWALEAVSEDEWAALKRRLEETYRDMRAQLAAIERWDGEEEIGGAVAIAVHTAYHLGEIRQALCVIHS
jgi:hypothetical protein